MSHRFEQSRTLSALAACVLAGLIGFGDVQRAAAFCGFYVAGADSQLYANATMVVLMRDGSRTVLSMQNNYQGPPNEFALVIPVPAVLKKEQVKVLPKDVFKRVDALGAPRLVEYWETDPCRVVTADGANQITPTPTPKASAGAPTMAQPAVRIEAQFTVGEYDIVVLSADDSSALDTWLRDNKYNIPAGAGPVLAPYVASGMKFFVAKVDPARVTFNGNQAELSPLRFHYDTPEFSLPVRLGLLNSSGSQDLIVNILAQQRYEVANYPNVTVPTNIRVQNEVRDAFGSFYEALYSRVQEKNPGAVVTEYSWAANSCDPCPTPSLSPTELATLGADVLQSMTAAQPAAGTSGGQVPPVTLSPIAYSLTLTRLHARYTKDSLGDDLVFKQAPGIIGGRGIPDTKGMLEQNVAMSPYNNFQGRYVILHPWEGALTCQTPSRGTWGGPPNGNAPSTQASTNAALSGAAPKAGDLPTLIAEPIPALAVNAKNPRNPLAPPASTQPLTDPSPAATPPATPAAAGNGPTAPASKRSSSCAVASVHGDDFRTSLTAGLMLSLAWTLRRRVRAARSGQP